MQVTLANLKDASAQQVFDQVASHLLTQKAKSVTASGCAYRGDNGLMCAAGCLIADSEYNPEFDSSLGGTNWVALVNGGQVPTKHEQLIDSLQTVHDLREAEKWEECLQHVAVKFGLEFKGVECAE